MLSINKIEKLFDDYNEITKNKKKTKKISDNILENNISLSINDKENIRQNNGIEYLMNYNDMNKLSNSVDNLIEDIQKESNHNYDELTNKKHNNNVKKAITTRNIEKNNIYYNKYNDFMLENNNLNELQNENTFLNYNVDRYKKILALLLGFIILVIIFSSLIKLSVFLSVGIFILIFVLLVIVYLIVFKNKSILKKIITPLP